MRPRARILSGLTVALAALAAVPSAHAASFGCTASAARIAVLGHVVEPLTANATDGACATDVKTLTGAASGLPAPVSVSAVVAATEVHPARKGVLASGGVADLRVLSLPSLPITLPVAAVPGAARSAIGDALRTTVDLTPVKAAIPVLALDPLLPTNLTILDPILGIAVPDVVQNTINATLNVAISALNATRQLQNDLRASIPDTITVDGTAGLDAALSALLPDGKLPSAELLRIQAAMAYAAGSCADGTADVSRSAHLAGIRVLGADIAGTSVDRTVGLIDTAFLDPSQLTVPALNVALTGEQSDLIDSIVGAETALATAVETARTAIRTALDGLPDVKVLDATTAHIKVAPGAGAKAAKAAYQQGASVMVSIAGQPVVSAVLGEAQSSANGVDCSAPVVDPGAAPGSASAGAGRGASAKDPLTPAAAALQCTTRRLVLVDVLERRRHVALFGVADPALAGETVSIVFGATGETVGSARVARDGSFRTTAPLPPAALRGTNEARYRATLGDEESTNLKLRRRMLIDSMDSRNGKVTITGRVVKPLARPLAPITLTRRTSCTREVVEERFTPRPDGTFRVTVDAPRRAATAVYRLTTAVRYSAAGSGVFKTYTLPRAIDLDR